MPGVEGKRVLVTGANRGIGLATANLLASRGAFVCGVSRNALPKLPTIYCNNKNDEQQDMPENWILFDKFVQADLCQQSGCRSAVEQAVELLGGPIDVLVCNHGMGSALEVPLHEDTTTSAGESAEDLFRRSMATNVEGPYYLTRLVLPTMVAQRYGRLVYTSSTASTEAEPAGVGYNTSKAALNGLMRSAAQDGGPYNVTSNAVLPGWVRTEMAEEYAVVEAQQKGTTIEKIWEERAALYPPKRVVTPLEVAHTILFLASEEASGVNGEAIRVSLGSPL